MSNMFVGSKIKQQKGQISYNKVLTIVLICIDVQKKF